MSNDGIFLDEDLDAFAQLSANLHHQYTPASEIEKALVDGIVWTLWRLRRLPRIEAGWHSIRRYGYPSENIVGYDEQEFRDGVTKATQNRYAAVLATATAQDRTALAKEIQQKAERNIENGLSSRAWYVEGRLTLSRYEGKLERRLTKLLAELEKRQMTQPPEPYLPIYPEVNSTDCSPIESEIPVPQRRFGELEK